MTTITIDKKDKDILAKVCAEADVHVYFHEQERGTAIRVTLEGCSGAMMFYLGRQLETLSISKWIDTKMK